MQNVAAFGGGLNANAAPDKVAENEVIAAYNMDFSLEEGAAVVRRGTIRFANIGTSAITALFRNYNNKFDYGNSPWYAVMGTGLYRATGAGSFASIKTIAATDHPTFSWYDKQTLIGGGDGASLWKDDGTTTVEWVKQAPAGACTPTIGTLTGSTIAATYTVAEGVSGANGTATHTGTSSGRVTFTCTPPADIATNGGGTIGDYGVDYLEIAFSNPENVVRISRDFSIDDANFISYFHSELDVRYSFDASPEGIDLSENSMSDIDIDERNRIINEIKDEVRAPVTRISRAKDFWNLWAIPRTAFELVTKNNTVNTWESIGGARIVVECSGPCTVAVRNWEVRGAEGYPLNDSNVGYAWWETFAEIDNGVIIDESAASPVSTRLKCKHARATVVSGNSPSGTSHGFTHRILYRQGGYLRDAYAVATNVIGSLTFTDTTNDITALKNNQRLTRNVLSRVQIEVPTSISKPYFDRTFIMAGNMLRWSEPGQPGVFKTSNYTLVSHEGDEGQAVVNWMPSLVIVNRDSIYEFAGSVFDGAQRDWQLYRTGAKRGSKAWRTVIETPFGIPILDYDGIFMYRPGGGQEQPLLWAMDKIGVMFQGATSTDPALLGGRVQGINKSYLNTSFAVWANNKLYLGVPTAGNTVPDTLIVLDFVKERVQLYTYPFSMTCGWWDAVDNRLYVGTLDGKVMQLETTTIDRTTADVVNGIPFSLRTRKWSWPNEGRLTNLTIDSVGTHTAYYAANSQAPAGLGTRTNTARDRYMPTMSGSLANAVDFTISGTHSNASGRTAIYNLEWDFYPEPPKELYHRTEYAANGTEQEFMGFITHLDCLGGTVTATFFVDGVGTFTTSFTGTAGPKGYVASNFPRVYGLNSFIEYRSTTPFRHYKTDFLAQPEPPRVTFWRTDYEIYEGEQEWKAVANQLDCLNGTATCTVFIDNVSIGTYSFTGNGPQGYVAPIPPSPVAGTLNHKYGRSAYAIYTASTPFKHYKTWFERLPEPSRVTHFRTPTAIEKEEFEWRTVKCELNCFGANVVGVTHVDGTAVATHTFNGDGYKGFVFALPIETYGRSAYTIYTGTSAFKHYTTDWDRTPEPPRVNTYRVPTITNPSQAILKTWIAHLNCFNSPVQGVLRVNDVGISTATFTGVDRQTYNIGLDVNGTGLRLNPQDTYDVVYTTLMGGLFFKHYNTEILTEPTPPAKQTWQITYRKIGGASQLDLARYWSMDVEALTGTATVTAVWDIDGVGTNTSTFTVSNRTFIDRQSFPPGCRGFIFAQRVWANAPIKVWSSNLDVQPVGIKGFTRRGLRGEIVSNG